VRILLPCRENYPALEASSYVFFHQSMALEELGHEVHWFNLSRPPMRFLDYLDAYDFDLIYLDTLALEDPFFVRSLAYYRNRQPVRVVGAIFTLPNAVISGLSLTDLCVTPWRGPAIERLGHEAEIRYLPLGYSSMLHRRGADPPRLGPVFVGNLSGRNGDGFADGLAPLHGERVVLCIGPSFEQKFLDPFMVGTVYASSRCLPNFHAPGEKGENRMLNERFWQTARCGVPVNDYSNLMEEVLDAGLREQICFAGVERWQERIRRLNACPGEFPEDLKRCLDRVLDPHSYNSRMKQLLDWIT